MINIPFAVESF